MLIPALLLSMVASGRTIMHFHDLDFFLYNALLHDHLFRLFLAGARPDSGSCSPSKGAADNRTAGPTDFGTHASAYAADECSAYNRTLVHIARERNAQDAEAERQDCYSLELHCIALRS